MNEQTTMILIDTALASGSASALDPEERNLQELVLTVRNDAPAPDPDFALRMNARVAAGFPPRRSDRFGRVKALLATRPQLAAMGAAASLLIALVVAVSVTSNDKASDQTSALTDVGATESAPQRDSGAAAASGGAGSAPAESAQKAAPAAGVTSSAD